MELLEGAPLSEHITSLKEKSLRFSEDRIWHLFSQVRQPKLLLKKVLHTSNFYPNLVCMLNTVVLCILYCTYLYCVQIIRALRYLHKQKRIVHRDLKPANIMVGDKDKLTISKTTTCV